MSQEKDIVKSYSLEQKGETGDKPYHQCRGSLAKKQATERHGLQFNQRKKGSRERRQGDQRAGVISACRGEENCALLRGEGQGLFCYSLTKIV